MILTAATMIVSQDKSSMLQILNFILFIFLSFITTFAFCAETKTRDNTTKNKYQNEVIETESNSQEILFTSPFQKPIANVSLCPLALKNMAPAPSFPIKKGTVICDVIKQIHGEYFVVGRKLFPNELLYEHENLFFLSNTEKNSIITNKCVYFARRVMKERVISPENGYQFAFYAQFFEKDQPIEFLALLPFCLLEI